ncbi:MAG: hypothetical protein ABSH53_17080 [Holophaga sp.]|jgi:hypothetical protein
MSDPKPQPPSPSHASLTMYLDLWNILLILAGVTLVLLVMHF